MAVVLLILKIIGIILLAAVCIALFVLLVLLLAPAQYKFSLTKDENLKIDTKITWLFSLFSVQYKLENDKDDLRIKIPFVGNHKDDKPAKSKKRINMPKNKKASEVNVVTNQTEAKTADNKKSYESEFNQSENSNTSEDSKIKKVKEKIADVLKKIKEIVSEIIKYKNLAEEFDVEFGIKRTLKTVLLLIKRLFKMLKPKAFKADAVIGFDDPADTGMLIGAVSMALPFLPAKINIEGDYQNNVIKGNVYIKGRTNILLVSIPIIQFLVTKPVWDIIKKYWRD